MNRKFQKILWTAPHDHTEKGLLGIKINYFMGVGDKGLKCIIW